MRIPNLTFARTLSALALLLFLTIPNSSFVCAQSLQPLGVRQTDKTQTQDIQDTRQPSLTGVDSVQTAPYKLSSRFHLQTNSNHGYLVVKMEMRTGSYIYSMTQAAPLKPSTLKVADSRQFRLSGTFTPDRPPTIIEKDPIFEQRLEKHKGVVQFFVPIEIAPGTDPKQLSAEIVFNGQVCTDQGMCMPLSDVKAKGKFAGFFSPAPKTGTPDNGMPQRNAQRTNSQSDSAQGNQIR